MSQSLLQKQMKNSEWGLPGLRRTQTWPSLDNVLSCCLSVWTPLACKHATSACCCDTQPWTMVYSLELRHHFKERLFCDKLCMVIMLEESVQMYWFLSVGEWTYSSVELSYTSEKSLGFTHHWRHHILLNHDPQRVSARFENCFFFLPQQGERSLGRFSTVLPQRG